MPLQTFAVAGISYRTAPVDKRECYSIDCEGIPYALQELRGMGAEQAAILSTCNRTEVYVCSPRELPLHEFFETRVGNGCPKLKDAVYTKRGMDAAHHLLRVAAGLDSQVLGESEIMNQVKRAWSIAKAEETTGPFLEAAFQHALVAGKKVRSQTELGRQVVSIASLAVRLAVDERESLADATVLILGTGEMGARIAKEIKELSPKAVYVVSHTLAYAEKLAASCNGEPLAFAQLEQVLPLADIVFTVTTAPHPVLDRSSILPAMAGREHRPLVIFDLGVPRNTAPEVRDLPFVRLHDIEDLRTLSDAHRKAREREIPLAERLVEDELDELISWSKLRSVVPMISALRTNAEEVRQYQLSWALSKMGSLTDGQREILDQLTNRLVKQLLHHPISELRNSAGEEESLVILARMFGLPDTRCAAVVETTETS